MIILIIREAVFCFRTFEGCVVFLAHIFSDCEATGYSPGRAWQSAGILRPSRSTDPAARGPGDWGAGPAARPREASPFWS